MNDVKVGFCSAQFPTTTASAGSGVYLGLDQIEHNTARIVGYPDFEMKQNHSIPQALVLFEKLPSSKLP